MSQETLEFVRAGWRCTNREDDTPLSYSVDGQGKNINHTLLIFDSTGFSFRRWLHLVISRQPAEPT